MAREEWIIQPGESRIIDVDLVDALKLALISGHVDVVGHDEPGARIEVTRVTGKSLKVVLDGTKLTVDHPQLAWDNFLEVFRSFKDGKAVDISILVPRTTALNFGIVSAEGLVTGIEGKSTLSTVSGSLVVDGCADEFTLNTVSGDLTVSDHDGPITVHGISAEVTVSGVVDELDVDTVSGDVFADLRGSVRSVKLNSVSGDLTARIPAESPIDYKLNTVSGRVRLGSQEVRGLRGGLSGRVGTGTGYPVSVRANTVSGDVAVLGAQSAPFAEADAAAAAEDGER